MGMSIRNNISSLNSLRHTTENYKGIKGNIERLSSGLKINRASDSPATLIASERLRSQVVSMKQALENAESSVTMVQTAEGALNEVSAMLINIRQLAVHAANEAINDRAMLAADQNEISHLLESIDRIGANTMYNSNNLLDGSNGASGVAVGPHLEFVTATPDTATSPEEGFKVNITQVATRANIEGTQAIDLNNIENGVKLIVTEKGRSAVLDTSKGDLGEGIQKLIKNAKLDPQTFPPEEASVKIRNMVARSLQKKINEANIEVDVSLNAQGLIKLRHREFGDDPSFSATSSLAQVLSPEANVAKSSVPGKDVEGTINGETALGEGQFLNAVEGTTIEGLSIQYTRTLGDTVKPVFDQSGNLMGMETVSESNAEVASKPIEGYVHVNQSSINFQIGPQEKQFTQLSIGSTRINKLARGLQNNSGFESLEDIDVRTMQGARDAMKLVDRAIDEVSDARAELGSFQKNALESNMNSLRIAEENLTQAESTIRDADMAEEMSELTGGQILLSSSTAMLAQANQVPQSVLGLVTGQG